MNHPCYYCRRPVEHAVAFILYLGAPRDSPTVVAHDRCIADAPDCLVRVSDFAWAPANGRTLPFKARESEDS